MANTDIPINYDLSEYIDELTGDVDIDQLSGANELDAALAALDLDFKMGGKPAAPAEERQLVPPPEESEEVPMNIDETITLHDMKCIIRAEIKKNGIAGHHIQSMNEFYRHGLLEIITGVYALDGRVKNLRDKTEEDLKIVDIHFHVDFTDIKLHNPTTTKYKTGKPQMLTPSMARIKSLTYSSAMYLSARVTATAYYKDGSVNVRKAEVKDHRIGSMPTMLGTEKCNTYNSSREMLKDIQEDPSDHQGYFIIKGGEWCIVSLENQANNLLHIYKKMMPNEIVQGRFLSKPGDAFENSYQIVLRYLVSGAITVEITTNKFEKIEIPYYLIFRALGMTRDREIVDHIVYGVDNTDPITKGMLEILAKAFAVDNVQFGAIRKSTDSAEIVAFIGARMLDAQNNANAWRDENVSKYINSNFLSILDRMMFPHIGGGIEHRIRKLRFLAHSIHKILRVHLGVLEASDRDSLARKRAHAAGVCMGKAVKTAVNFGLSLEIKKQLIKDFKQTTFSNVSLAESITSAIDSEGLERMLTQVITTGNKTITIKRNEITNRISSQQLYPKNDVNIIGTLRTLDTSSGSSQSKQNERADEMRRVQPTYQYTLDPIQSPDTGEKIGLSKQQAATCSISAASSSYVLKRLLLADPAIIPLDEIRPAQVTHERLAYIKVNGDWIGSCKESHVITAKYRSLRRRQYINPTTTIVWEPLVREVQFLTDVGRMMFPLIIVYNNINAYITARRAGDKKFVFRQWIKLTKKHIHGLQTGDMTMDTLRDERVIEYIAPEEHENAYVARNINVLKEFAGDVTHQFTHMGIDQAILGLVSLAAPLSNHSNTSRATMYTNHRKAALGWFKLSWPFRMDKGACLQYYIEQPLITAFTDSLTTPTGQNAVVALMLYSGYNCEDSVILSKSSVDRGLFNASCFNYEKTELEKGEQFGNVDYARTMDIKRDAIYEYCENGFIKEGTIVKKGYILIVKAAKINKPIDNYTHIDKSVEYRLDEEAFVEKVITPRDENDSLVCKVKLRAIRHINVGDKLCLDGTHDVLCKRGWIPIAEVTLEDEVACLNNGVLEYSHPTEVMSYEHDGEMYEINTQQISQCVTLNHRMYVKPRNDKNPGRPFELIEAQKVKGKRVQYKKDAINNFPDVPTIDLVCGDETLTVNMDHWLDLLGIFISDGWVDKDSLTGVTISAEKQRKVNHINAFCTDLGFPVKHSFTKHRLRSKFARAMLVPLSVGAVNKFLPEYVFEVSQRQARVLMASLISGDGYAKKNGCEIYCTSSKRLADDVCRLALHCGWSGNVKTVKKAGYTTTIPATGQIVTATVDSLVVKLIKSKNEPMVNHGCVKKQNGQSERVFHYKGSVYCITVPSHVFYVRRERLPSWTGNSSRSGNKGVISAIWPSCDMPYDEDGLKPDIIVNGHSIPTRMAINQIIECCEAQLAVKKGCLIDATTFSETNIEKILSDLLGFGVKYGGQRRMYNGKTGTFIDMPIFIGNTYMMRLSKFIAELHYAIRTGPTMALTRQPLGGRKNDGGLKIGEMEKDVYGAHGCMRALFEKFYPCSDGIDIYVCRICGNRAIINEREGIYKCKHCGDAAEIAIVKSSWVANLFMNEVSAMNIRMGLDLKDHQYSEMEPKAE